MGLPPFLFCVDVGSTFTKAVLVDTARGEVVGTAQHRTTLDTDVMDGIDACRRVLATDAPALICSSAGGGLRIAVVGNEELVTAEAGRRVALSSGGRVVAVLAGGLKDAGLSALADAEADVILLVGGTDGGNAEQLLADAAMLAQSWTGPVVVAGDAASRAEVATLLADVPHVLADNVVPRIGVLAPDAARRAMREIFLTHVIGGKGLSSRADFAGLVLGPTPDVVLLGVEALAAARADSSAPGSGVVVVDVGGATTDVHSVIVPDPEDGGLAREVVATTAVTRTVEGDLGMRWSATTTADAAADLGLALPAEAIAARASDPGFLAATEADRQVEEQLATAAVVTALRRHAGRSRVVTGPDGRVVERSGKDLRGVELLLGSGGVLRTAEDDAARGVLAAATGPDPHGWQLPENPDLSIDRTSVLAAVGLVLLYGDRVGHPAEAAGVAQGLIWTSVLTNTGGGERETE